MCDPNFMHNTIISAVSPNNGTHKEDTGARVLFNYFLKVARGEWSLRALEVF